MNLEIANCEQSKEIANLVNQAYRGEIGWTKESHLVSGDRISSKKVEDIILAKNLHLLIVRDDLKIISCCCVEKNKQSAYFGLFAVHPNLQSKGIGKSILNLVEKYVKNILHLHIIKMVVISQRKELIS